MNTELDRCLSGRGLIGTEGLVGRQSGLETVWRISWWAHSFLWEGVAVLGDCVCVCVCVCVCENTEVTCSSQN